MIQFFTKLIRLLKKQDSGHQSQRKSEELYML